MKLPRQIKIVIILTLLLVMVIGATLVWGVRSPNLENSLEAFKPLRKCANHSPHPTAPRLIIGPTFGGPRAIGGPPVLDEAID